LLYTVFLSMKIGDFVYWKIYRIVKNTKKIGSNQPIKSEISEWIPLSIISWPNRFFNLVVLP
jgi:hypothetical protein